MAENPLKRHIREWLPKMDFAVMQHGFAPHGRDYVLIVQAAATYELVLTHVVECHYETRVRDDVWPSSWDDCMIDYAEWLAAGEPGGYVWGTNWSLASGQADVRRRNRDRTVQAVAGLSFRPMEATIRRFMS